MPGYEVLGKKKKKKSWRSWKQGSCFATGFRPNEKDAIKLKNLKKSLPNLPGNMPWRFPPEARPLRWPCGLGVGFGDEVITSGFTFVATWEAILERGRTGFLRNR